MTVRALLADDHALFRAGLRKLLETFEGVEIAGEAADGHEALELVERYRPHLLILDIAMPGLNGIEVTARVVREHPSTRVIVLSMHSAEEYVLRAIRAGADGYVLKDATPAELEEAIRTVSRGHTYLHPAVSRHVVEDYVRRVSREADPVERLTPRQREVLQLIAEGHTTKGIAQKLGLSVKTVESHRAQLMERLEIHDVPGLVRFAIRCGLIKPED
ncbi:MAG: response regulator transcription factor [Candidatus Rokubacteria bacterium]|nr:response regulator transcription factor [Candidatus Rokubacteria bacterium]